MSYKLGKECKAYYGTAGTNPSTSLDATIKDVAGQGSATTADFSTRASGIYKIDRPVELTQTMTLNMLRDTADAGQVALRTAYVGQSSLALKFLDGTGGKGFYGDWYVTSWNTGEPRLEGATVDITVTPAAALVEV